jgi:hypothetical protein
MNVQPVAASWASLAGAALALLQPELFIAACLALAWLRTHPPLRRYA